MAFIDNVRVLSGKSDEEKEAFLIEMRVRIELSAKYGYHQTTFWTSDLEAMARKAISSNREPTIDETFKLFGHACIQLVDQGFKLDPVVTREGSTIFTFTW